MDQAVEPIQQICPKCEKVQEVDTEGMFLYHEPCYPEPQPEPTPIDGVKRDPKKRQTGKAEPYAYTVKDKMFGEFKVLNSANAWWLDPLKVHDLISAYKIDYNDEEASAYAGISTGQLEYLQKLHPEFLGIKTACKQHLGMKAKKALADKVEHNPEWYLTMKRKDEYSTRQEITGKDGGALVDTTNRLNELIASAANIPDEEPKHPASEPAQGGPSADGPTPSGTTGAEAAA